MPEGEKRVIGESVSFPHGLRSATRRAVLHLSKRALREPWVEQLALPALVVTWAITPGSIPELATSTTSMPVVKYQIPIIATKCLGQNIPNKTAPAMATTMKERDRFQSVDPNPAQNSQPGGNRA
jgi:hypothetical protein